MKLITIWRRVLLHVRSLLLPDAKAIAKRAWSLRFIELAAAADIILNIVPVIGDWLPWWLTLLLLGGAWLARLVLQPAAPATEPEKEAVNANK